MNFSLGTKVRTISLHINLIQFIISALVYVSGLIQWSRQQNKLRVGALSKVSSALKCLDTVPTKWSGKDREGVRVGVAGAPSYPKILIARPSGIPRILRVVQSTRKARVGRAIFDGWHRWYANVLAAKQNANASQGHSGGGPQDVDDGTTMPLMSSTHISWHNGTTGSNTMGVLYRLMRRTMIGAFKFCDWKLFALENWHDCGVFPIKLLCKLYRVHSIIVRHLSLLFN